MESADVVNGDSAARRSASDELCTAQEDLQVRGLCDLRHRASATEGAQAIVLAAAQLVANVEGAVVGAVPEEAHGNWEKTRVVLDKPGHFINALRRFPSTVDAGRLPYADVEAARQLLAAMPPVIEDETAMKLGRWAVA